MPDPPTDDTTDLTDFGGGTTTDPPQLQKRHRVQSLTGGGHAGHIARAAARPNPVFVAARDSHDHRLRYLHEEQGGAYAISDDVLRRLADAGVQRIFIRETDTGDVYEWPAGAFYTGEHVPDAFLETTSDPQRYATRDSAEHVWDDLPNDTFYEPQGAGFERASDRDGGDD